MDETKKKKPDEAGEPEDKPKDNAEAPEEEKKNEPPKEKRVIFCVLSFEFS